MRLARAWWSANDRGRRVNKELKRVSFVVLAMFVALFLSTSLIQVGFADNLKADGRNARTLYASYSVERGAITVDGLPIAAVRAERRRVQVPAHLPGRPPVRTGHGISSRCSASRPASRAHSTTT